MAAPKILVVYYSRSGTTRRVASALSATLNGSVEEIVDVRGRNGLFGYWRSVSEARRKQPADILPVKHDPSKFDLVVIGTPVWAWSVSSPVRAYLTANKDRLPDVAFFCTLGANGSDAAFAQMQAIIGKHPRATCAITDGELAKGKEGPQLTAFAMALQVPPPLAKSATMANDQAA